MDRHGTDRRRARGLRTKAALIRAALELFSANGYGSTTVEQIATSAGVAPRTFFHHFATKDDILFTGYVARLDEAIRRFRASTSVSLWGALAEASEAVAQAIAEQPDIFLARARLYGSVPTLRATMLRINEDWIDQLTGEIARWLGVDAHSDLRPRLAATLVNGASRAAIELWVSGDGAGDLAAAMTEAMGLVQPSIRRIERTITQRRSERVS